MASKNGGDSPTALDTKEKVRRAMLAKLADSMLTPDHARKLGFEPFTAAEVEAILKGLPVARAGFRIPYCDLNGKPITSRNGKQPFFRFRYLEYGIERGFGKVVARTMKLLRYGQPEGTDNALYLPHKLGTEWSEYAKDKDKPLIITEGELKAACGTVHGFPTIGLGGVSCAGPPSDQRDGRPDRLMDALKQFAWKNRDVYICFDSDAITNPDVIRAENVLAGELVKLGAKPKVCRIPPSPDVKKMGMDDAIAEHGANWFKKEVLGSAVEWKAAQELHRLNEEVLYVKNPGIILVLESLQRMQPRAFVEHAYSDRLYYEEIKNDKGTKLQERSAPKEWLKWPGRNKVKSTTYLPGEGQIVNQQLNLWPGWNCAPVRGDVSSWKKLRDYLLPDSPDDRKWFEQWLAYPFQHPGRKLYSAAVLWGKHHGTGKSLIGYTMFAIYGKNATEIGDRDLYSTHNEWAENKQFVMADEITGGDKRSTADRMKSMITQKLLRLNPKYVPSYTVPDCINYYFTSNHADAFFLEDTDRRFFIHEVKGKPLPIEFYKQYVRWLEKEGGKEALFYYLLHLDLTGFDPEGHAPVTSSKLEMIETTMSDAASWVARLLKGEITFDRMPVTFTLFREKELIELFRRDNERVSRRVMWACLREKGIRKFPSQIRISKNGWDREYLWAHESLHGKTASEYRERFLKERNNLPPAFEGLFGPPKPDKQPKYASDYRGEE